MSAGSRARKYARSSSSAGVNRICAGPPTRNHVNGPSNSLASRRPRSSGIAAFRSALMSGKLTLFPQCLQFARQRVGPLRDVARAKQDNEVVGLGHVAHDGSQLRGAIERNDLAMSMCAQAKYE